MFFLFQYFLKAFENVDWSEKRRSYKRLLQIYGIALQGVLLNYSYIDNHVGTTETRWWSCENSHYVQINSSFLILYII